eukprot:751570-Alexandrium_andersonii.AAC.1
MFCARTCSCGCALGAHACNSHARWCLRERALLLACFHPPACICDCCARTVRWHLVVAPVLQAFANTVCLCEHTHTHAQTQAHRHKHADTRASAHTHTSAELVGIAPAIALSQHSVLPEAIFLKVARCLLGPEQTLRQRQ